MEFQNFTILKRDGSRDQFSLDKIMTAIIKAFEAVGENYSIGSISKIISHLDIKDDIKVEDIQNQVEIALMKEGYFSVAKAFMLYRQSHTEDRETLDKLNFLTAYMEAANAATGSKFDANANVEHKNIATLIGELPKSNFIRLNRRLLTDRMKKMYGKELADKYIDLLTHHFIYKNDETNNHVSLAHWRHYRHWWKFYCSNQSEELLRWLRKHGVHRQLYAIWRVCYSRVPDVSELLHR